MSAFAYVRLLRGASRLTPPVVVLLLLWVAPARGLAQDGRSLFDGESLAGWEIVAFGGQGPVVVRDGAIVLGAGDPMTGITWRGEFPTVDYEVTLEARKVSGNDFFAAITFPVRDDPCTLVIGGWGGGVVGLSSIDGADALQNVTTRWMRFDYDRWYAIRLRVTEEEIQAWIDDEAVVDFAYPGHELSVRIEVLPNIPFGIATWYTTGELRNIRVREIGFPLSRE